MNSDRLASVIAAVDADNRSHGIPDLLAQVEATYTTSVQQPDPTHGQNFNEARKTLSDAARDSFVAKLSPSRLRILDAIGGARFVYSGLEAAVEAAISESTTPSNAIEALQTLRSDAESFFETISEISAGLKALGVSPDDVAPGDAEVEIRIPDELVDSRLRTFGNEAIQLSRALEDISETAVGTRAPITIRGFDSGSIQIYIQIDPVTGAAILTFVTAVIQLITSIVGARQSRATLERDDAPADALRILREWESERISNELARIRDEILEKYDGDSGRKNELRNALSTSLEFLADRIDRGLDISVFSTPLEAEEDAEDEETNETPESLAHKKIEELGDTLGKIDRPSKPVLMLEDGSASEEDENL